MPTDYFEIQKNKRSSDQYLMSANRPSIAVADMVRQIAENLGLSFHMPPDVEGRLSGHSLPVIVKRLPLAEVLSALLEPSVVTWRINAGKLELTSNEHPEGTQADRIRGAMRRALIGAPDHPCAAAVRLSLANFDYEQGKLHQAIDEYQRLIEGSPHRPQAMAAAYNLGLIHLGLSDFRRAREQFLNVADRAPDDRWTALAWWWIRRCSLDAGEWDEALSALKKSMKYGGSTDVKPAVTLGISAIHCLRGELVEAHDWLRQERKSLNAEPYRNAAALIDALAICRAAHSNRMRSTREEEDLVQAIHAVGNELLIGPASALLFGEACREIGLEMLMVPQYEKALDSLSGPLAKRLTFELAEHYLAIGQTMPAREKYLALAAADQGSWGSRSRLQLADIALKEGKLGDCLRFCRQILKTDNELHEAALIRMGKALARQGRNDLAAECFAGRVPMELSPH